MAKKRTSILIILLYIAVFLSPLAVAGTSRQLLVTWSTFAYILGACLMIVLYRKSDTPIAIEQQGKKSSLSATLLWGIGGIFIALLLQSAIVSIQMILTHSTPTSANTEGIISVILENKLFILATFIGGPIMEEFVFRRSLIDVFTFPKTGFWLAAVISSALFSVIHQDGNYFVYFFLGLFFALLYKKTGRIWTSIIAHCGMNTLVVVLQLVAHYMVDMPK